MCSHFLQMLYGHVKGDDALVSVRRQLSLWCARQGQEHALKDRQQSTMMSIWAIIQFYKLRHACLKGYSTEIEVFRIDVIDLAVHFTHSF